MRSVAASMAFDILGMRRRPDTKIKQMVLTSGSLTLSSPPFPLITLLIV